MEHQSGEARNWEVCITYMGIESKIFRGRLKFQPYLKSNYESWLRCTVLVDLHAEGGSHVRLSIVASLWFGIPSHLAHGL